MLFFLFFVLSIMVAGMAKFIGYVVDQNRRKSELLKLIQKYGKEKETKEKGDQS